MSFLSLHPDDICEMMLMGNRVDILEEGSCTYWHGMGCKFPRTVFRVGK